MPDIALLGERSFLFEKLFQSAGHSCQFVRPGLLGSPFLPSFKVLIIPTGFANSLYSQALPALKACTAGVERFVKEGGVLVIFGPLILEHGYEWLPLDLGYQGEYNPQQSLTSSEESCCIICTGTGDCDGYLLPGEEFKTVLKDSQGRPVMVAAPYGHGMIIATTVHEYPSAEFIRWACARGKASRL